MEDVRTHVGAQERHISVSENETEFIAITHRQLQHFVHKAFYFCIERKYTYSLKFLGQKLNIHETCHISVHVLLEMKGGKHAGSVKKMSGGLKQVIRTFLDEEKGTGWNNT